MAERIEKSSPIIIRILVDAPLAVRMDESAPVVRSVVFDSGLTRWVAGYSKVDLEEM